MQVAGAPAGIEDVIGRKRNANKARANSETEASSGNKNLRKYILKYISSRTKG